MMPVNNDKMEYYMQASKAKSKGFKNVDKLATFLTRIIKGKEKNNYSSKERWAALQVVN
jgi:hypothetical protein